MNRKIRSNKVLLMFILGAFFALPAWCQVVPKDAQSASRSKETDPSTDQLNDLLKKIQNAKSAKVVLVDIYTKPRESISKVPDGCTYVTQEPAQIANLVKIIRQNVKVVKGGHACPYPTQRCGECEYVSLELANGETSRFVFQGPYCEPVVGYARLDTPRNLPIHISVETNSSYIRALYGWAVKVEPQRTCAWVTDYLKK